MKGGVDLDLTVELCENISNGTSLSTILTIFNSSWFQYDCTSKVSQLKSTLESSASSFSFE